MTANTHTAPSPEPATCDPAAPPPGFSPAHETNNEEDRAITRLVGTMCDMMRGNAGKTFYVATENSVSTFVIPAHRNNRERSAFVSIMKARQRSQNVVGCGVVHRYI